MYLHYFHFCLCLGFPVFVKYYKPYFNLSFSLIAIHLEILDFLSYSPFPIPRSTTNLYQPFFHSSQHNIYIDSQRFLYPHRSKYNFTRRQGARYRISEGDRVIFWLELKKSGNSREIQRWILINIFFYFFLQDIFV